MIQYELDDLPTEKIVNRLENGEVFIYPTDTVAGIGCDATNQEAVHQVFKCKRRELDKPVSFAFSSIKMVEQYVSIPSQIRPVLNFLPGPLTIILSRHSTAPRLYGASDSIGVRIPKVDWLLDVITALDRPIVTTSANISGRKPPSQFAAIDQELLEQVDFAISWKGRLSELSSTVISALPEIKILREGVITEEKIFSSIG